VPSVDLAHDYLTGSKKRPEEHSGRIRRGQHRLGLNSPFEFLMQAFNSVGRASALPLARRKAREGEEPIASFVQVLRTALCLTRHLRRNALRRFSTSCGVSA
jgi:hypothetical protein